MKVDHNFNERQRLFGRYTLLDTVTADPNFWQNPAMPNNGDLYQRMQNAALDYTQTLSATAVLNVRYGFGRVGGTRNPAGADFDPAKLGFPAYILAAADHAIFPTFSVQDFSQLGPPSGSYWRMRNYSHSLIGNLTKSYRRHSLKFGFDGRLNYVNFLQEGSMTGGYNFTRAQTQGPDPRTPSTVGGSGLASFLLGTGNSGSLPTTIFGANSNHYFAFYVNDDFKVSSKLSLNIGLRWDFETGVTERYDRIGGIDPLAPNPLSSVTGLNLTGGFVYPGKGIDGRAIRPIDPHEINPRFGFAYSLNSKTVIRSAYGIFFGVPSYTANPRFIPAGYSTSTAWVPLAADGVTPSNLLSNPFPGGFEQASGSSLGLGTLPGAALSGVWPAALLSNYNQQWNFTVQRGLSHDLVLEVAYAGNKGTHLSLNGPVATLDQLPVQLLSMGNQLLQPVPNPFYGIVKTGILALPTVQRGYLLRPSPQFTSVVATYAGWGNSDYHALQTRLEKRFDRGLGFLVSYTWSKTITDGADGAWANNNSVPPIRNTYCRACDRSLSSFDQAHRFITSFTYELPLGRGKAFGGSWNKGINAVLGQWQVNGVLTLSSGLPLVFGVPQNTSFSFGGFQTPDATGMNPDLGSNRTVNRWFDTSQFSQPANFTFGTLGRVASGLRSDGARNVDFSLFKSFRIRERVTILLRGESFNVMNHPEFSAPGTTVNTPLFGMVSSQANLPRQLQIGLKVLF